MRLRLRNIRHGRASTRLQHGHASTHLHHRTGLRCPSLTAQAVNLRACCRLRDQCSCSSRPRPGLRRHLLGCSSPRAIGWLRNGLGCSFASSCCAYGWLWKWKWNEWKRNDDDDDLGWCTTCAAVWRAECVCVAERPACGADG